jgi:hypothetical protein
MDQAIKEAVAHLSNPFIAGAWALVLVFAVSVGGVFYREWKKAGE